MQLFGLFLNPLHLVFCSYCCLDFLNIHPRLTSRTKGGNAPPSFPLVRFKTHQESREPRATASRIIFAEENEEKNPKLCPASNRGNKTKVEIKTIHTQEKAAHRFSAPDKTPTSQAVINPLPKFEKGKRKTLSNVSAPFFFLI
ncbi:hypothetical protein B0T17DRAFT_212883 [Bombardia bombarda]|uniref:Uncharacterized protein n=1 Tax=Bombardia bombarda TaxID=252184 RepID=A0AA40C9L3_9PEZI|nr:hypothetical protein B0T17DRAFT_212883 [Bombardia bombarda]